MGKKFEHWVPDALGTGIGQLAVFFTTFSSTGYLAAQIKYMKENPDIAEQLKIEPEALQQAYDSFDGNWDDVTPLEISVPE